MSHARPEAAFRLTALHLSEIKNVWAYERAWNGAAYRPAPSQDAAPHERRSGLVAAGLLRHARGHAFRTTPAGREAALNLLLA